MSFPSGGRITPFLQRDLASPHRQRLGLGGDFHRVQNSFVPCFQLDCPPLSIHPLHSVSYDPFLHVGMGLEISGQENPPADPRWWLTSPTILQGRSFLPPDFVGPHHRHQPFRLRSDFQILHSSRTVVRSTFWSHLLLLSHWSSLLQGHPSESRLTIPSRGHKELFGSLRGLLDPQLDGVKCFNPVGCAHLQYMCPKLAIPRLSW